MENANLLMILSEPLNQRLIRLLLLNSRCQHAIAEELAASASEIASHIRSDLEAAGCKRPLPVS